MARRPRRTRPKRQTIVQSATAIAIGALACALIVGCLNRKPAGTQIRQPSAQTPSSQSRWHYIVVHHSATTSGSAATFDTYHRETRKWRSLGYHFVIGNGSGSGDGQIEIGPRWHEQSAGAHCQTSSGLFNRHGIGICLVGNFDQHRPTKAQLDSLNALIRQLADHYGIAASNILGHREAQIRAGDPPGTRCPGKLLDMDAIRRNVQR